MVEKRSDAKWCGIWMPLNTAQLNRLKTGQMDAILFFYVLVQYSNVWSCTKDIAHRPTIWIPKVCNSNIFVIQIPTVFGLQQRTTIMNLGESQLRIFFSVVACSTFRENALRPRTTFSGLFKSFPGKTRQVYNLFQESVEQEVGFLPR